MALADATDAGFAPIRHGTSGHDTNALAVLYCDEAIDALKGALTAIAEDDVTARCYAVSTATEAATRLYLELDVRACADLPQIAGRYYEAILTRLVHINLCNDAGATGEAIGMLARVRETCVQTRSPSAAAAGHGALSL